MGRVAQTAVSEFEIDRGKAVRIGRKLFDDFSMKRDYFKDYQMPEYVMPPNLAKGSREHALYLTYVISIDYLTDASILWERARAAYHRYPQRFEPMQVLEIAPATLEEFTKALGARYPKRAAQTWRQISKTLLAKYESDPRQLTPEPLTITQVKERLKDFSHLRGPKLSNFYLRAMAETNLFKISDFDRLDIAVDIQVTRFTAYTGVVRLLGSRFVGCVHQPPLRGKIEEAWREAAGQLGLAPWQLDSPIWTVGSRLCSKRQCASCPVSQDCSRVEHVTFRNAIVDWIP